MRTMNMSSSVMEVASNEDAQVYERSKVFGFPEKEWLGVIGPRQILVMALVNQSEHDMDVVLTLYDDDGSVSSHTISSTGGYIPNLSLNEINRIPAGQARKVFIMSQGNPPVSSGKVAYMIAGDTDGTHNCVTGLVVNGRMYGFSGPRGAFANILVNNGKPF